MATKVTRGQLLVFTAAPKDELGVAIVPTTLQLYLNYVHADGTTSTDVPIDMEQQSDGTFRAEVDTADMNPGAAFASLRAESPAGAEDIKFTITANAANPDPATA